MANELIPITVNLTSWCHKFLTNRALRLGRNREAEAGRLLSAMCLRLIREAEAAAAPVVKTYTEAEFNEHMRKLRMGYLEKIAKLRERLGEPADADREDSQ